MGRIRRRQSSEQKIAAIKRHLLEKVPVSEICEDLDLQPSVLCHWQRPLFENADKVLGTSRAASNAREKQLEAKIATLEAKLVRKDSVIAEISEEHVKPGPGERENTAISVAVASRRPDRLRQRRRREIRPIAMPLCCG